jgi:hypothetical protein
MIAASAASLRTVYGPKQDFLGGREYVDANRRADEPVVTASLAIYPYNRYYRRDWPGVERIEELNGLRARGHRVWIVYAFAEYLADGRLRDAIEAACSDAAAFPGTLGGGDVRVCVTDAPRTARTVSP